MIKRQKLQKSIIIALIFLLLPLGWAGNASAAIDTFSRLIVSNNEVNMEVGDTFSLSSTAIYTSGATDDVTILTDWNSADPQFVTVYNGMLSAKAEGVATITGIYLQKQISVKVTVSKKVRSLTKNKTSVSLRAGFSDQIILMATYTDNTVANVTYKVNQWSSSNDSVANVVDGKITGINSGSAVITAKYGSQQVTIPVEVDKVLRLNLEKNTVSLTNLTLKVGSKEQIQVMALFDNGDYENISNTATWTSDLDNVAYAYKGLITAYKSGEATITASYGTKTAKIVVDVDVTKKLVANPSEAFLHVNSAPKSIVLNAFYADGSSEIVTTKAKWESNNDEVATVSNGVITAFSNGTASISASYGGKTTIIAIDVDVARKLDLDSTSMQINVNTSKQAKLKATYADGTVEDVTYKATWTTDNTAIVYVNKGTINAISTGQAVVTAQFGNNTAKLVVDVDVAKGLTLNKTSLSLRTGDSADLVLTAALANNEKLIVTDKATWTSDNNSIAYVTNGSITAISSGQAVITAKYNDKTATITVQVEIPTRLEVDQSDLFLNLTVEQQLSLLAYFPGSSDSVDVTGEAEWTTSNESIASVTGGLVKGITMGQATIIGKYGGKSVSITVDVETIRRLTVDKSNLDLRVGEEGQAYVMAYNASGESNDVTELAVWSTDNEDIASVIKGIITPYKVGHATISAVYGGKKVTVSVNVDHATLLTISKQTLQLQTGDTETVTVEATYSDGSKEDVTEKSIWKSTSTAIAEVKNGTITANDKGETKITASYGDRTVTVTVMIGIAASLVISKSSLTMKVGDSESITLTATFKDGSDKDVSGEAVWSSTSDKVAKVNSGVIKAYSSGKATITVKYGAMSETLMVEVDLAAKLSLDLKQVVLPKDSEVQVKLTVTYNDRSTEDVTNKAIWKSSAERIADVVDGLITSYSNGKATITGTYGGKSVTVPVQINVATKIYLDVKEVSLKSGYQQKLVLKAEFADGSKLDVTDYPDVEWKTASYSVADIDQGTILANSYGKTTLTAKYGGKSTTVKVIVDEVKYLKIAEKNLILAVKDTKQVNAKATFKDNSEDDVSVDGIWSSSNDRVADVKDGIIVAYGVGKATITCKFAGKTVKLIVTVK